MSGGPANYDSPAYITPYRYKWGFKRIWDSVNGEGAWERNDFVFAYSFREVERG